MILVTGGAGYIGSHICLELLNAGHAVVVFDNLVNGNVEALRRVEAICGRPIAFQNGDLRDPSAIERLFSEYPVEAVIHLAGLKSVEDSVRRPLSYFDNNVKGALHLLLAMENAGVRKLVFSSSATVYGEPEALPLSESARTGATNPYGRTKWMIEHILQDVVKADPSRSFSDHGPVLCQVRMLNESPLIPDFEWLERMISEETRAA